MRGKEDSRAFWDILYRLYEREASLPEVRDHDLVVDQLVEAVDGTHL